MRRTMNVSDEQNYDRYDRPNKRTIDVDKSIDDTRDRGRIDRES